MATPIAAYGHAVEVDGLLLTCGLGPHDPDHRRDSYRKASEAGRVAQDIPVNHSPNFAPMIQSTCDTGTQALVVATLEWLGG